MHIDETVLARVRAELGRPIPLAWEGEVTERERDLVARDPARRHDVTLFVLNGDRLALIRKPHFETGIWRTPGGGVKPGEEFAAGVVREALEEIGAAVTLERYLVHARAVFRFRTEALPWETHVLAATTDADELVPRDTQEIAAARWGTVDELAGPIRGRLLATGRALWRYRVALHDAAIQALADG
ncbi:MAG TPA: NUDIX hydrolase [Gaiellaceae bacterium]|nr:NUDIX hydrolase [Gaiellaceae bacterium]